VRRRRKEAEAAAAAAAQAVEHKAVEEEPKPLG